MQQETCHLKKGYSKPVIKKKKATQSGSLRK